MRWVTTVDGLLMSAGYDRIEGEELIERSAQNDDEDTVNECGLTVVVLSGRPAIR
jgi:hypothetical protein